MRDLVLTVEDDPQYRRYLVDQLTQAGYETCEAETGVEALDAARALRPRVVLVDVHLPGLTGYEICRRLRDEFGHSIGIAFVSGTRIESYDRSAGLLVGADDYLVKSIEPDELVARVRALMRRLPPPAKAKPSPHLALTKREREILSLLAEGLKQGEIARRLVISPKTVGTHIEHVLSKLGVSNRAQAVAAAYQLGILAPNDETTNPTP